MFTIDKGSKAHIHLLKALDHLQVDPDAYAVKIAALPQTREILVKVNEGVWSHPLSTEAGK